VQFRHRTRESAGTNRACIIVVMTTAALASWLPARRAARLDPTGALRG